MHTCTHTIRQTTRHIQTDRQEQQIQIDTDRHVQQMYVSIWANYNIFALWNITFQHYIFQGKGKH